jgi:hypothetical protein
MSSPVFGPGTVPNTVKAASGQIIPVPKGWILLPPGDAALTRRVKLAGEHWIVQEKKGRRIFSQGIWAPLFTIERIRAELEAERSSASYSNRRKADSRRREKAQGAYVEDFTAAVVSFLGFHPRYAELALQLAKVVADHATPIGSGTVARTRRIPIERRAEAAVIAWMRHQTTAYDSMEIPRIKGRRREVRQMLAQRSHSLLAQYRQGEKSDQQCPLRTALSASGEQSQS